MTLTSNVSKTILISVDLSELRVAVIEEGRANDTLCEFLADTLDLPRRAVTVQRGDTSRQKTVRIDGLSLTEVRARLGV